MTYYAYLGYEALLDNKVSDVKRSVCTPSAIFIVNSMMYDTGDMQVRTM